MSPQDDIRAKRLAKLGSVTSQSQPQAQSHAQPQAQSASPPAAPAPPAVAVAKPASSPSVLGSAKGASPHEVLDAWTTKEIESILQLTLDADHVNTQLTFLESTFTELAEEDKEIKFSIDLIDRIIIEKLSEIGIENPFRYLKDSWVKTQQSRRLVPIKDPQRAQKLEILNEIDRLTSSYGLVAFQIPDMFLNGDPVKYLKDIISNENSYSEFLIQIVNRSNEEGTILEFLNIFIPNLSKLILNIDLNNPQYPLILNIFQLLLNEKHVAAVFTQVDGFKIANDQIDPNFFEIQTILGPIFRLSPLQDSVALNNFDRSIEKSKLQIKQIGESLQSEHKVLLDRLFFIANKIIRGSETSRTDLLQYFSTIVNKNHLRRGDHSDFKKLSSNAFMVNISLILIRLSQPFLDLGYTKIDKIDINYFSKNKLIDIADETKTNSTNVEAKEYFEKDPAGGEPTNFISDCFFLTLTYLHYGIGGLLLSENKVKQQIKQLEKTIEQIKNTTNAMQRLAQLQLPRLEKNLNLLKSQKDSIISFLTNRNVQLEVFDFICGASTFLIRVVDPAKAYPHKPITLPFLPDIIGVENVDNTEYFRSHAPVPFKYYPEYLIEGIINYCNSISKFVSNPMILNPRLNSFIEFAITFLRCPELFGNPHLKGKLVEVLFLGSLPINNNEKPGFMVEIFESNQLVNKNLLYALLDFYVIVEKTGSSSQFYDKFNSRYHISTILEELWKIPVFKNQLINQSEFNEEFFIRFIARMLNDLTFLLDESLTQLSEVHNIQVELEFRQNNNNIVGNLEGTVEELHSRLAQAESQSKSYVGLANKSIDLFGIFTEDIPRSFVKSEIVDRLASMLDYNLEAIAGPKCSELKVKNPEKYSFNPKNLLINISKIFVNLSQEEEFINAVSRDGRSFKISTFNRATDILNKHHLVSPAFLSKFKQFAEQAESRKLQDEQDEENLGEVPDEFLDPLMYTLMKDPVILPGSKVNIDRSTIRAHLLSDSTDPFNRMPLKLEDVVPNEELKKQIDEWRRRARASGDNDTEMSG